MSLINFSETEHYLARLETAAIIRNRILEGQDLAAEINTRNQRRMKGMNDAELAMMKRSKFAFFITRIGNSIYVTAGILDQPEAFPFHSENECMVTVRIARDWSYNYCHEMGWPAKEVGKGYTVTYALNHGSNAN